MMKIAESDMSATTRRPMSSPTGGGLDAASWSTNDGGAGGTIRSTIPSASSPTPAWLTFAARLVTIPEASPEVK